MQGPTPALTPPYPAPLPLWLALLLKRQGRANVQAPPWLSVRALTDILALETLSPAFTASHAQPAAPAAAPTALAPPFLPSCVAGADARHLPYHWLGVATLLLEAAADDVPDAEAVRRLLRDLREARAAKMRAGVAGLEGGARVRLDGVGGLEVASEGGFVRGVMDGLRMVGASREAGRKEKEEREGGTGEEMDEDEEEEML